MRDVRFKAYVDWTGKNTGVARVGTAKVSPLVNSVGYAKIGSGWAGSFAGSYKDISGPGRYSALDFVVTRGRTSRWGNIMAGECQLGVHDMGDGRYNPWNLASPLAGLLRPMRPFRLTAILENGVTEVDLFNGWLDEASSNPDFATQRASFNFKDLLMILDGDYPVVAATGPIYVGDAIGLVLDWFDFKDPALRSLARGSLLPSFQATGITSGLALVGEILTVDLGVFFASRKGVATYFDRWEYARRASIGSFSASDLVIPGVSRANIRNKLQVTNTRTGGTTQTVLDQKSRDEFGPLAWPPVSSPYFNDNYSALQYALYKVAQSKNPSTPAWTYSVMETSLGDFDKMVQLELLDRLTVQFPTAKDFHAEKVVHRGVAGEALHTDLVLSERAVNQAALVERARVAPNSPTLWADYARITY